MMHHRVQTAAQFIQHGVSVLVAVIVHSLVHNQEQERPERAMAQATVFLGQVQQKLEAVLLTQMVDYVPAVFVSAGDVTIDSLRS